MTERSTLRRLLGSCPSRPVSSKRIPNEDIRLCTINRADDQDTYGVGLNFHTREHFHSFNIALRRANVPSNAQLAGIRNGDHLIEVNGENIQRFDQQQVLQRIRAIKYPQPLQVLVVDALTYKHCQQQKKVIHRGLPNVQIIPPNKPVPSSSNHTPNNTIQMNSTDGQIKTPVLHYYRLDIEPGGEFGFDVVQENNKYFIRNIETDSPAAQAGLHDDDCLIKVNNENVSNRSHPDVLDLIRNGRSNGVLCLLVLSTASVDQDDNVECSTERNDQTSSDTENSSSAIKISKGNLITQHTDVIVVCSSSQYLFDNICKAGGDSFSNAYHVQYNENLGASITAVDASGKLACKRVYFLPWKTNSDIDILRESIERFVSDAIEKAVEEQYRSIAFPAIGCGQYGCSISLVAQTMVEEAYRQLLAHRISITFVIQPSRGDIYDEFRKQVVALPSYTSVDKLTRISKKVGQATVEVEQGDITLQTVDVIVDTSSSDSLRTTILTTAGAEVQTAYDKECKNHPNAILIATPPGSLSCKQIFFIKWQLDEDENTLQQSLNDIIVIVIQNAISHQFTSIAFPAIECDQQNRSLQLAVKTMVKEMKIQLIKRNLPWLVKFIVRPDQTHIYDEYCKQVLGTHYDTMESQSIQLPATWEGSRQYKIRFLISPTTDEYKSIVSNFNQTMQGKYTQIIRVERIQNERWYLQYIAHCRDFKKRFNMDTEKLLYHGCPQQVANSIIQACFNRSFAGVNGTLYGVGVYFASYAAYSHGFATPNTNGERCMFVARVLVGKTTLGNSSMKIPPPGFDSTTDGKHIFVTYHDAQAYAEYLITYK